MYRELSTEFNAVNSISLAKIVLKMKRLEIETIYISRTDVNRLFFIVQIQF